jgi:hypothetical protein
MTTAALEVTQKILPLRSHCPHYHAVVSYLTQSLPPKEQCYTCPKPLKLTGCKFWQSLQALENVEEN